MIKTRIWFLVVLCMSLFLGNYPLYSAPPYPLAIACVTNISFFGNVATVDSFDSSDPNYSDWNTNWGYGTYDPAKAKANGNVGTDSTMIDAIEVGNANIFGHVDTGPGGTAETGPNGYVGPLPQESGGFQNGYTNDDMNVAFPDVTLPVGAGGWQNVPADNIITVDGNYYTPDITSNLTINASNVTIYVAGSITLRGTQTVTTTTLSTHAVIYVAGPSISLIGNSTGVNNGGQRASTITILGLPTLTNITITSTNSACTIYAPETDFSVTGSAVFVGAIVAKSAIFESHPSFHFDESLANTSAPLQFLAQPQNTSCQFGRNTSFNIYLQGWPMDYQWYFNQTNLLADATNSTLSLTNVQFSDAGAYSVVATNWSGSITSAPASLIVYTNAAATLADPLVITNGLQLTISGVIGLNYVIQSSADLINWVSVTTNQPPFTFSDTNIPASSQKFYRAVCFP